jgi:hypothetical protein
MAPDGAIGAGHFVVELHRHLSLDMTAWLSFASSIYASGEIP